MKEYAVNIGDLTKDNFLAELLLSPVIPNRVIVEAEIGMIDGGAVLLECDEDRAKGIVDVIRIRHNKNDIRCYERKKGKKTWKRI